MIEISIFYNQKYDIQMRKSLMNCCSFDLGFINNIKIISAINKMIEILIKFYSFDMNKITELIKRN